MKILKRNIKVKVKPKKELEPILKLEQERRSMPRFVKDQEKNFGKTLVGDLVKDKSGFYNDGISPPNQILFEYDSFVYKLEWLEFENKLIKKVFGD